MLRKLLKKFKQLELEGVGLEDLSSDTQKLFNSVMKFGGSDSLHKDLKNKVYSEDRLQ